MVFEGSDPGDLVIVFVAGLIIGGGVVGGISIPFLSDTPSGAPVADTSQKECQPCLEYSCVLGERNAEYELKENHFSGKGSMFGINPQVSVPIKNIEAKQGAYFSATLNCDTQERSPTNINTNTAYLGPGTEGYLIAEYDIGNEDWSCDIIEIRSSTVGQCELREV